MLRKELKVPTQKDFDVLAFQKNIKHQLKYGKQSRK